MKYGFKKVLIGLVLGGVSIGLSAQEDVPISVSSQVDKARITIGDLIHYSVMVTHDDTVKVEMPGFAANLGGFEIRDYKVQDPRKQNGKIVTEAAYTISTFFTGAFEIPPLTIYYTMGSDTVRHALTTEKIDIQVESLKASEAGDIRDVKPPVEIPRDWWYTLRWYILGLVAALLILTGILLYRRHKTGQSLLPVRQAPPRPAHEIALEALDQLTASDLLAKGEVKQFYIELSEIIREYINGRYFVVALEMTTTEVLEGLSQQNFESDVYDLFRSFLWNCDMVKFAKYQPSEKEHQSAVQMAYDIVENTKLIPMGSEAVSQDDQPVESSEPDENNDDLPEGVSIKNVEVND